MDPRLTIDVDHLGVDGWTFEDALPQAFVSNLLAQGQDAQGADALEAAGDLAAKLKAYKVGDDGLILEGKVQGALQRPCGRCLGPALVSLDMPLHMTLFPAHRAQREAPAAKRGKKPPAKTKEATSKPPRVDAALDLEDVDTATYRDGKANVAELLREALLLETPFSLLCKPDCLGLCQTCGSDLNVATCACPKQAVDPRWAGLGAVKL